MIPVHDHIEELTEYTFIAYGYLLLALILAVRFVLKEDIKYKFEIGYLSFFLMSGNLNSLFTLRIPGVSAFEIQPERFLFLIFSFLLLRRWFSGSSETKGESARPMPMFEIVLYLTITLIVTSLVVNISQVGIGDTIVNTVLITTVPIMIYSLKEIANEKVIRIIGKSILVGAVATTTVGIIQLFVDEVFLRLGILRIAYGDVLRSIGIFDQEYIHSFFLIMASIWVLVFVKKESVKLLLVIFFSIGILTSFHRMSMLSMMLVLVIYYGFLKRAPAGKLVFTSLLGITGILSIVLLFSDVILNSEAVQNRIMDSAGGRAGYYSMVFDHIGKKPLFGFGNKDNEVYYSSMLNITKSRRRADGQKGGIHNGYLTIMFYHGIPAFCCFTGFVILAILYFGKLVTINDIFMIPFLAVIVYGICNLTNTLSLSKYQTIIVAVLIGVGMAARYMPSYFNNQKQIINV